MSRNQTDDRMQQLGSAIGPPKEGYSLSALARMHGAVMRGGPMLWAQAIHAQYTNGDLRPTDRWANPLKLRAMFKAFRLLAASDDLKDLAKARDLSKFLESPWGISKACVAIGGDDLDAVRALREQWGDAQLPPADATVNGYCADYLLIEITVRRLG